MPQDDGNSCGLVFSRHPQYSEIAKVGKPCPRGNNGNLAGPTLQPRQPCHAEPEQQTLVSSSIHRFGDEMSIPASTQRPRSSAKNIGGQGNDRLRAPLARRLYLAGGRQAVHAASACPSGSGSWVAPLPAPPSRPSPATSTRTPNDQTQELQHDLAVHQRPSTNRMDATAGKSRAFKDAGQADCNSDRRRVTGARPRPCAGGRSARSCCPVWNRCRTPASLPIKPATRFDDGQPRPVPP